MKKKKMGIIPTITFGALVSLGREITLDPQIVLHNPYHFQICGAYFNMYCIIVPNLREWKCVICRKLNSSNVNTRKQA